MTLDDQTAKNLGMAVQAVGQYREKWNQSPESAVVREWLRLKLTGHVKVSTDKLLTCSPDELKRLQGEISALKLAETILTQPLREDSPIIPQ